MRSIMRNAIMTLAAVSFLVFSAACAQGAETVPSEPVSVQVEIASIDLAAPAVVIKQKVDVSGRTTSKYVTVNISPGTVITRDGNKATAADIKAGDKGTVEYTTTIAGIATAKSIAIESERPAPEQPAEENPVDELAYE